MADETKDQKRFDRLRLSGDAVTPKVIQKRPRFPADVLKRFPSLEEWQRKDDAWVEHVNVVLRGGQR